MIHYKRNSERWLIVGRSDATMLLRVFDMCYKMGVNDACEVNDGVLSERFCKRLMHPGFFGRVNDDTSYEWLYWQLTLQSEIIKNKLYKSSYKSFERYVANAGRPNRNFLGVAYTITKCFYALGIREWEACRLMDLAAFNSRPRLRLTKEGELKNWNRSDIVSEVQKYCFKQKKIHAESGDAKHTHSETQFMNFIRVLALASQKRYDSMT